MKIGVDGTIFVSRLTGIGNFGYHVLRAMARQAPEFEFVVLTQQPLCVEFSEENISVHLDSGVLGRSIYFWKLFGMAGACADAGVKIFWAASGVAPFFMPCPLVLTVYDFVYRMEPQTMCWRTRWFRHFNQPWWVRRAAGVVAITQSVSRELQEFCARRADAVVFPAADGIFYRREEVEVSRVRVRYGLGLRYNLVVGTLEPRKNLHIFIPEYLAFHKKYPDIGLPPLVLIGGKGWRDASIVSVVDEGERNGMVRRLGYVPTDDLPQLYSGAELLFMPSRYEGFGMPVLEARMCGCAVVCSDILAMREAGGAQALYHAPDADGIRGALEAVYLRGHRPDSDLGSGVDWSWESSAVQVLDLLTMVGNLRTR